MSVQAKAFIKSLLCVDPEKRPSAKEALKHQWFSERSLSSFASKGATLNLMTLANACTASDKNSAGTPSSHSFKQPFKRGKALERPEEVPRTNSDRSIYSGFQSFGGNPQNIVRVKPTSLGSNSPGDKASVKNSTSQYLIQNNNGCNFSFQDTTRTKSKFMSQVIASMQEERCLDSLQRQKDQDELTRYLLID